MATFKLASKPVMQNNNWWIGIIVVILQAGLLGVYWWKLPPYVPLFYSLSYGSSRLVPINYLLFIPVASMLMWILYLLSFRWLTKSEIAKRILLWMYVVGLIFFSLALVHSVLIVT